MSNFREDYIITYKTTGNIKRLTEEFRRTKKEEAKRIDRILRRFKK
jgi:hypothetical protein